MKTAYFYDIILTDANGKERRKSMQNIEVIKEKNVVLVPLKSWEKIQKELISLRKRAAKAELLSDLSSALAEIQNDLKLPPEQRKKRQSADDFLRELSNGL